MPTKMLVTGIGIAISFIIALHFFAGSHQLEIFALFLALTSCVYGGAILTPAGAKYTFVELPFVVAVFISSVLGLLFSPLWLALGYVAHGAWDTMHHFQKVHTPVVKWFPPLCAAFDVLISILLFGYGMRPLNNLLKLTPALSCLRNLAGR